MKILTMVSRICRLSAACRQSHVDCQRPICRHHLLLSSRQQTRWHASMTEKANLVAFHSWLPNPRQISIAIALLGYTNVRVLSQRRTAVCAGASVVCSPVPTVRLAAQRRCRGRGSRGSRRRGARVEAPPQSTHPCDALSPAGAQASMHASVRTLMQCQGRPVRRPPAVGFASPPASTCFREQQHAAAAAAVSLLQ